MSKNKKQEELKEEIITEKPQKENNKKETKEKETKEKKSEDKAKDVESSEEIIEKLKLEVEDWKNSYMRKQADFQNFTKRKEKEMEELRKFASEKIIVKLLDGIDNLSRAVETSKQTSDFESLSKGVEMTLNQFKQILKTEGVEAIETDNKEFDPQKHMAVMVEESEEVKNNHIIMELQKGYSLKGKVVRPSMVKVCKK
ncbi:nucleotide exchange factor GrpE [Fusobacterium sp. IOR10]|uniref:nucleotide exchange factor GrpE n=1 Tax=Fusobacterium sp. IOR10 TaxID=2665157 RepID=UPI00193F08F3|nr:nucleotide exchange factor GrpE [Fusobacterium sp. IOR10]